MSRILQKKACIIPSASPSIDAPNRVLNQAPKDEDIARSSELMDTLINSVIANIDIVDSKETIVQQPPLFDIKEPVRTTCSLNSRVRVDEPKEEDSPEIKKNFMFISDRDICNEVKKQLTNYTNLRKYDTNFINRNCQELIDNNIEHIWLNISDDKCREWLKHNIKSDVFKKILVFSSNKRSKFLDDVMEHVDLCTKLSNLNKLNSLSLPEMVDKVEQYVEIHDVPNKCLNFFGCGSSLIKKKKKN